MGVKKGGKAVGHVKQQQAKQANVVVNGKVKKQHIKQATVVAKAHPKQDLSVALHALLERSATKEDMVYETEEVNGTFITTLQVAALETERTEFKGKPAESRKLTEANAAQKCLNVLQKEIKE